MVASPRILVIGDAILDRYVFGHYGKPNPERPGQRVFVAEREECRLGGAAHVASQCAALGAAVELAYGIKPDDGDRYGNLIMSMLDRTGIREWQHYWRSDETTVKTRFVVEGEVVHRTDRDASSIDLAPDSGASIKAWCHCWKFQEPDLILIADYGKGVCTPELLQAVIDEATARNTPVLVDPARGVDWKRYRGATLIKCNHAEWREAVATQRDADWLPHLIVTRDRQGMTVNTGGESHLLPAATNKAVDVTGAGDVVLAVLGVEMARGQSVLEAAKIANVAAGLSCEHVGTHVVPSDVLTKRLAGKRLYVVQYNEAVRVAHISVGRLGNETTGPCQVYGHPASVALVLPPGQQFMLRHLAQDIERACQDGYTFVDWPQFRDSMVRVGRCPDCGREATIVQLAGRANGGLRAMRVRCAAHGLFVSNECFVPASGPEAVASFNPDDPPYVPAALREQAAIPEDEPQPEDAPEIDEFEDVPLDSKTAVFRERVIAGRCPRCDAQCASRHIAVGVDGRVQATVTCPTHGEFEHRDQAAAPIRFVPRTQQAKPVTVFTNGVFDLLHAGHIAFLQAARKLGDRLVVAVNTDDSLNAIKPGRPYQDYVTRAANVSALECVDEVRPLFMETPHGLLEALRPDVLVKGGTTECIVGREVVERYGGKVVQLPSYGDVSTTRLAARLVERLGAPARRQPVVFRDKNWNLI